MTLIRNSNQTKQGLDFTGVENGKIHPTDIDAVLEFDNDALILIEVKRINNHIPTGQRLVHLQKSKTKIKIIIMKLGDLIYYITKYTGIKYLVDKYHEYQGTKCKCDDRRKKLNNFKISRK